MQEASNISSKLESSSLEIQAEIFSLKKDYFHKFTEEKDLYKYCLKSKEIRFLLQLLFSIFNYCEEAIIGSSSKA
jgi:hypothetical protein